MTRTKRDHIFISYAWEDGALAEWLALKLTSEGYKVWIDRYMLLGGEPWPKDIDSAIEDRAFRVVHLISRFSLKKPNPTKERIKALAVGKHLKIEDFLITLNVDNTSVHQIPFEVTDINYIQFDNWATGHKRLVTKLEKIGTPRSSHEQGAVIAASVYIPEGTIVDEASEVTSNLIDIEEAVQFAVVGKMTMKGNGQPYLSRLDWTFRPISASIFLSLDTPPSTSDIEFDVLSFMEIQDRYSIDSANLIKELLRRHFLSHCMKRGLRPIYGISKTGKKILDGAYVPVGHEGGDQITINQNSRPRKIKIVSKGNVFSYHLALDVRARETTKNKYEMQLVPSLHLTDATGTKLPNSQALYYRRQITRSWFNGAYLGALLKLLEITSGRDEKFLIASNEKQTVTARATPNGATIPYRIDDKKIEDYRKAVINPRKKKEV